MTAVLRRSLVAFATALALVAIAAVPGVGSATFNTAVDLSADLQSASSPQVAVGPDGATTITWYRSNGANAIIQATTRPAGSATFSTAVNLSAPGQDALFPQVAVGPDGATTITWQRSNGTNRIIQAATRPAGSATFSAAVDLSAPGQDAWSPKVAVGPDGATTITWNRSNGTKYIIQAATRPAGSATFSAAVNLSAPGQEAGDPQVAVGPDGATTITWSRYNGTDYIIQASSGTARLEVAAAFTVLSVKAGASALRSRVTLPGPGVLSQSARSTGSKRVRVCAARKKVSRASTVWIVCPLTRATKRALLHRSLRVRVITTITPTGGVAQVHTKIIRLGARRATTAGTG